jgi:acyl-coenzyme A thioesterase PaaI-like protein
MPIVRIHNEDWGFDSNCFVCEDKNPAGLRIPFFHDTDQGVVVASFSLPNAFSGAPAFVHGGVVLAVLDEAMAWACIAVGHRWAVTSESTTRFLRPVRIDSSYRVVGRVDEVSEAEIRASATIFDGRDRPRAESSGTFTPLGEAQAVRAIGGQLGVDRSYLRADGLRPPPEP